MNERLVGKAKVYEKRRQWKKIWKNIVSFLGCVVVFCTTYALILPAVTLDQGPECGIEEHQHDSTCYLLSEPIQTLVCQLPEIEEHVHSDACYEQIEIEMYEPDGGEVHTSSNAITRTETVLVCGEEETAGHTHGDGCYEGSEAELILVCTLEEHIHTKNCVVEDESEAGDSASAVADETEEGENASSDITEAGDQSEMQTVDGTESGAEQPESSTPANAEAASVQPEESTPSNATEPAPQPETNTPSNATQPKVVELPEQWESSFADVELKENWAEDFVAIAESQIGYEESEENVTLDENGDEKGYTRYGDWYGEPYADWNTLFLAFCMSYADVPEEKFPFDEDCAEWMELLQEEEIFHGEYGRLKPGDLIFFDHDKDGLADHAGVVRLIKEDGSIKTIEGDIEDAVQSLSYMAGDARILGFGQMPEKEEEKPAETLVETELVAALYEDATYQTAAEEKTQITISGFMPEGVTARAYPVEVEIAGVTVICAYDISLFREDGTLYEPSAENPVSVSFHSEAFADVSEEELGIHYVPEDGEPEKMETTGVSGDGISFEATHFSVYAVTKPVITSSKLTLNYNTQTDAFIKDPAYSKYYNANSPIGTAGSFHLVGFGTVNLNTHTNGNVLAHTLYAGSNFGTNNYPDELSYVQHYKQVNGGSASNEQHVFVLGSEHTITQWGNENAFNLNGAKLDRPYNLVQDEDTATAPFIDLERVEAEIRQISANISTYSTLDQASGVTYDGKDQNNRSLTLENPDSVGAITFKAAAISDISNNPLRLKGFQSGHDGTIVINVDCTGETEVRMPDATIYIDGIEQGTNEVTEFDNGKVIWNFINATGVTINAKRMTGMVIAPGATVKITQNLNGTVVAEDIYVQAESHRTDFTGKIVEPEIDVSQTEYYITVQKIETGYAGTTLPGATFDLYKYGADGWTKVSGEEPLTTNAKGLVTLLDLKPDTYYKLVETKAPTGYILHDGYFSFWIKSSSEVSAPAYVPSDFTADELKNETVWLVANDKMTGNETTSLTINKVWLTSVLETLENPETTSITAKIYQIPDGNTENKVLHETITVTAEDGWTKTIENLPLTGTVEGSETPIAYTYAVEEVTVDGFTVAYEQTGDTVTITNTQIPYTYELPETGGIGTGWYTICGLFVMAGAVMCGYGQRRRRERRFDD